MHKNRPLLFILSLLVLVALACQAALPVQQALDAITNNQLASAESADPALQSVDSLVNVSNDLVSQQNALISLYEAVSPGVVSIFVASEQGSGQGSGFVVDAQGHIVTNYHVVQGATYIEVSFASGHKTTAEIVGIDTDSDLAVIQVDATNNQLRPLPLGDSDQLQVGQTVIAIGNPFGLSGSMSTGIVSSLRRSLEGLNESPGGQFFSAGDLIQTDAAINPGNSGGPLLNLQGEVIGVNRAIRSFNTGGTGEILNSGIGFAVSSNIVSRVVPALIADGHYSYPYLGLSSVTNLTLAEADQLGLTRTVGVYVNAVIANGPSDRAGLKVGDMILAVDGEELRDFNEMLSYLFTHTEPGVTVKLQVLRGSEQFALDLTLGARP
ncbi:MAG: PDZ domain-containing protein [Chloroflexi bacterium]|nr:PDZ domain-containing protein [Chloroflexota bacterium]